MNQLHCWKDRAEAVSEAFGHFSLEHLHAAFTQPGATCMLPAGHEGPHEWTLDDNIIVSFTETTGENA